MLHARQPAESSTTIQSPVNAVFLPLLLASSAVAETLSGAWSSPEGPLRLQQKSDRVVGSPAGKGACAAASNGHLLEVDLLEDSLSGQLYVCLEGCAQGPTWVPVLLLVAPDGQSLSGASTIPKGCKAPLGRNGSLVLKRLAAESLAAEDKSAPVAASKKPIPANERLPRESGQGGGAIGPAPVPREAAREREDSIGREKAIALARDGAAFQQEGKFEQARHRFQQAVDLDPKYAEGFNGIGVTFFARNDLREALRWYKRALDADPSFGDAYYNMACVYALQKHRALALRYLRTAFHNGFTSRDVMREDPDLASLHGDPAFDGLLGEAP